MNEMQQVLHKVAHDNLYVISEEISLPPRQSRLAPVPSKLHPKVKERLSSLYPGGLYNHQAMGIFLGLQGKSLCVATPTASGKTVIFTSIATSILLSKPGAVVLALYPAKALIHDQERKWHEAIEHTGIETVIIHGGVARSLRAELLKKGRIVLMTPDVMHAWLLAELDDPEIRRFLASLEVLILDEAHIYDGVFGTNMAYLLRRLRAVSGVNQVLASSATIGEPVAFLKKLTGLDCELIGPQEDGTATPAKQIMLCTLSPRIVATFLKGLVQELRDNNVGRFLVFVDSRKQVEELASSIMHAAAQDTLEDEPEAVHEGEETIDADQVIDLASQHAVLPYRAGYEETDRAAIQTALTEGSLRGVISTSALELGIDIGEITLVVNLGTPPSIKSFWQRAGRAGRKSDGYMLLLDTDGRVTRTGLDSYLQRAPEPNWFYMDNEYLQYANALCAADESQQCAQPLYSEKPLEDLPENFRALLANEITPTRSIPHELYPLKQQALASGNSHLAFPVRTSIEKSYQVECPHLPGHGLGSLTYSQLLREAFPGALYRYMGRPYRVWNLKHGQGKVITQRAKGFFGITRATSQTMVFPQFADEIYYLSRSEDAFISECRAQVSLRVIGFVEQYGKAKKEVKYEPGCHYAQKPLTNYYDTTGVCFHFPEEDLQREALGRYIVGAFCHICAVQDRDVGAGMFTSNVSPLGQGQIRGFAVFDTTVGSLRLTRQVPDRLDEILNEAIRMAQEEDANKIALSLQAILDRLPDLKKQAVNGSLNTVFDPGADEGWVTVVAGNQEAICDDGNAHIKEEVIIEGYLYTPQGIRYKLRHPKDRVQWQVTANMIHPINGSLIEQYNINTGETRPMPTSQTTTS